MNREKPTKYELLKRKYARNLIMPFGFECGPGWYKIIEKLTKQIVKLYPKIEIQQVKEKFGTLRYYIGGVPYHQSHRIFKLIDAAEKESGKVCEKCGEPGALRNDVGWILTLCDKHHNERKEKMKAKLDEIFKAHNTTHEDHAVGRDGREHDKISEEISTETRQLT